MINKWIGMGRLTADPELKQTQSGVSTCTVNLAVQRDYSDGNGERQTDSICVVARRQTAHLLRKQLRKGSMIAVVGELRTRTYNDKRYPDVKHYVTEVYADKVSFCGGKNESGGNNDPAPAQTAPQAPAQVPNLDDFEQIGNDSDLPF